LPTVAKLDVIEQLMDNNGALLAGGKVYTYQAGTTTPLATYTDNTGGTPNTNPLVLDSSGRGDLWFAVGPAYKVVVQLPSGTVLKTVDGVKAEGSRLEAPVILTWTGAQPTASLYLGGERFDEAMAFGSNWVAADGRTPRGKKPKTLPTASYTVTIKQVSAGVSTDVGTAVCDTSGAWTFATGGGGPVSFAAGDEIDFYGSGDTTIADFGLTLPGTVSQ
jgi:hypothetical protein